MTNSERQQHLRTATIEADSHLGQRWFLYFSDVGDKVNELVPELFDQMQAASKLV